jgi:hypothetical protein
MTLNEDMRNAIAERDYLQRTQGSITVKTCARRVQEDGTYTWGPHTAYIFAVDFYKTGNEWWHRRYLFDKRVIITKSKRGIGYDIFYGENCRGRNEIGWTFTKKSAEKKAYARAEKISGIISRLTGAEIVE